MRHLFLTLIFVGLVWLRPAPSEAALSVGVGYNNPPQSLIGLNLMYLWTDWAVEGGVGYLQSGPDYRGSNALLSIGDFDVKYLLMSGSFRPFLSLGTTWSFSTTGIATSVGFGDIFYSGAGFFVLGSGVFSYVSYNSGPNGWFMAAGLGFDL